MKLWYLSAGQLVAYSRHRICFSGKRQTDELALRLDQFWNLDDCLRHVSLQRRYTPLGQGLWLKQLNNGVCFQTSKLNFTFHGRSWRKYKRTVHWQIRSFLRHDRARAGCELHARASSWSSHRFRRRSRLTPSQQTLSRSSSHASGDPVMRSQSSTLCQRLHSNHGQPFSFKSAVDELRNPTLPPSSLSSSSHADIDIEEFSSVCSIEEGDSSPSS